MWYWTGCARLEHASTPFRSRSPCGRRSPIPHVATAASSSSPAGTGSTPSATSRWHRSPRFRRGIRREGRRRRRAVPVHRLGREGCAIAAGAWPGQRPHPDRRRAGHPPGRQGPQRRLVRRRVSDGRRPRGEGRRAQRVACRCWSRSRRWTSPCLTRTSVRYCPICPGDGVGSPEPSPDPTAPTAWNGLSCTARCPRPSSPVTRSSCARSRPGPAISARRFARYEVVPQHVAAQLREAAKT